MKPWLGRLAEREFALGLEWFKEHLKADRKIKQDRSDDGSPFADLYVYDHSNIRIRKIADIKESHVLKVVKYCSFPGDIPMYELSDGTTTIRAKFVDEVVESFIEQHKKDFSCISPGGIIQLFAYEIVLSPYSVSLLVHRAEFSSLTGSSPTFSEAIEDRQEIRELNKDLVKIQCPSMSSDDEESDLELEDERLEPPCSQEDISKSENSSKPHRAKETQATQAPLASQMPLYSQIQTGRMLSRSPSAEELNGINQLLPEGPIPGRRIESRDKLSPDVDPRQSLLSLLRIRAPNAAPRPSSENLNSEETNEVPDIRSQKDVNEGRPSTPIAPPSTHQALEPTPKETIPIPPDVTISNLRISTPSWLAPQHAVITRQKCIMQKKQALLLGQVNGKTVAIIPIEDLRKLIENTAWLPSDHMHKFPAGNMPIETLEELNILSNKRNGIPKEDQVTGRKTNTVHDEQKIYSSDADFSEDSDLGSSTQQAIESDPDDSLLGSQAWPPSSPQEHITTTGLVLPPNSSFITETRPETNDSKNGVPGKINRNSQTPPPSTTIAPKTVFNSSPPMRADEDENDIYDHDNDDDNDDDDELELAVPQALPARTSHGKPKLYSPRTLHHVDNVQPQRSPRIHVQETPYKKALPSVEHSRATTPTPKQRAIDRSCRSGTSESSKYDNPNQYNPTIKLESPTSSNRVGLGKPGGADVDMKDVPEEVEAPRLSDGHLDSPISTSCDRRTQHLDALSPVNETMINRARTSQSSTPPASIINDTTREKRQSEGLQSEGSPRARKRLKSEISLSQDQPISPLGPRESRRDFVNRLYSMSTSPSSLQKPRSRLQSSASHNDEKASTGLRRTPDLLVANTTIPSAQAQQIPLSLVIKGDQDPYTAFVEAYPEYPGDRKHFLGLCRMIDRLERADRMQHKSLWDDFIIRHKAEYQPYLQQCAEEGEDPLPYERYYRQEVDRPLYTKFIMNHSILAKALGSEHTELLATPHLRRTPVTPNRLLLTRERETTGDSTTASPSLPSRVRSNQIAAAHTSSSSHASPQRSTPMVRSSATKIKNKVAMIMSDAQEVEPRNILNSATELEAEQGSSSWKGELELAAGSAVTQPSRNSAIMRSHEGAIPINGDNDKNDDGDDNNDEDENNNNAWYKDPNTPFKEFAVSFSRLKTVNGLMGVSDTGAGTGTGTTGSHTSGAIKEETSTKKKQQKTSGGGVNVLAWKWNTKSP